MRNLKDNQHNEYPQNIFEIGDIFEPDRNTITGIKEKRKLGILLCHEKTDFTEIKQVLDCLLNSLGLKGLIKESQHLSFIPGRVGEVYVNNRSVGYIGEFHPQVLMNWGITVPVVGLELELSSLF